MLGEHTATCLALLVLGLAPPQDPATEKSYSASHGYPCFGETVGNAGDVDHDGIPDLVVGDPGVGTPSAFWIISGANGAVLHRVVIPDDGRCAYRVEGGADVDGDTVPDILIACQSFNESKEGALYVVSGASGSVNLRIATRGSRDVNGSWARVVSDFDHDGLPDVASLDPRCGGTRGALLIFSGKSGKRVREIAVLSECQPKVCGFVEVGNVDRDGVPDFAVQMDGSSGCHGSVRLCSTATGKRIWDHLAPQAWDGAYAESIVVGDLDGDGVSEIAASFYDCVELISGRTGALVRRLVPKEKGDSQTGYGWALARIGDLDGDGLPDFAIAETDTFGFFGTIHGQSGGDRSELWSRGAIEWRGKPNEFDDVHHYGYSMAALGDLDGDGVSDLAVGSSEGPSGEPGLARVLSGKNGSILFQFGRKGDDVVVTRRAPGAGRAR